MFNLSCYRILQTSFLIISAFFLISLSVLPHPFFVILKVSPALLAAVVAFLYGDSHRRTLLVVIFLFLATGDFFLGLNRTRFFIFALTSFLIGNSLLLLYLIPYAGRRSAGLIRASITAAFSVFIGILIIPNTGTYHLPVFFYLMVICTMAFVSALNISSRQWLIFAGAAFFTLSDSLIAFDKFVHPVHGSLPVILTLYYIAVYCLCFGIIPPPIRQKNVAL